MNKDTYVVLLSNKIYEKFTYFTVKQLQHLKLNFPIILLWFGNDEPLYDFSKEIQVIKLKKEDIKGKIKVIGSFYGDRVFPHDENYFLNLHIAFVWKCLLYSYLPAANIIFLDSDLIFSSTAVNQMNALLNFLEEYDFCVQQGFFWSKTEFVHIYNKYNVQPITSVIMVWDNSKTKIHKVFKRAYETLLEDHAIDDGCLGDECHIAWSLKHHDCRVKYLTNITTVNNLQLVGDLLYYNPLARHYYGEYKYNGKYDLAIKKFYKSHNLKWDSPYK